MKPFLFSAVVVALFTFQAALMAQPPAVSSAASDTDLQLRNALQMIDDKEDSEVAIRVS